MNFVTKPVSRLAVLALLLSLAQLANAQDWSWITGSNLVNQFGIYGTQGTPAVINTPGARYGSASWTDAAGNLWLYGGWGFAQSTNGWLSDMWKYNSTTHEWTWMSGSNTAYQFAVYGTQGSPAAANTPGARAGSATWTDASGNFWLFSGISMQNPGADLWKYDPATNEWAWMKGASTYPETANTPCRRRLCATWTDASGNFWLFGGFDNSNYRNDLWKYDPLTNEWTYLRGGSGFPGASGTYGTQGTPSTTNTPSGRCAISSWTDATGDFWLFGGLGYSSTYVGYMNDLWMYHPSTNEWTWMKGANTGNQYGTYGTLGAPAAANNPGGRWITAIWTDATGNLWLFGGEGYSSSSSGQLNDLWRYTHPPVVDAGPDQLITLGYGPQFRVLTAMASGGTPPYTYAWSTSETSAMINVNPTVPTTYTVTVTDNNNYTATDEVFVDVLDWRCGNNQNKVSICHNGKTICVALEAVQDHLAHGDQLGVCQTSKKGADAPHIFTLGQNYPNPFNPVTQIEYSIPEAGNVRLAIFDLFGREVEQLVNETREAGTYHVLFESADHPSGSYVYRLEWNGQAITRRMTLMK
jgi:hypothetical protein